MTTGIQAGGGEKKKDDRSSVDKDEAERFIDRFGYEEGDLIQYDKDWNRITPLREWEKDKGTPAPE